MVIKRAMQSRQQFFEGLKYRPDFFGGYGRDSHQKLLMARAALQEGRVLPPEVVEVHLSEECNLKCKACVGRNLPENETMSEAKEGFYFTEERVITLVRQITDYWARFRINGEFKMSGGRGDPLTRPFLVKAAIEEAQAAKISQTGLFTNGLRVTPGSHDYLNGLSYLFWSRNGTSPETVASFGGVSRQTIERATNRFKAFAEQRPRGLKLVMGYVLVPENIEEAVAAIAFAKAQGCDGIRFKFDQTQVAITGEYRQMATALRENLVAEEEASLKSNFRVWAPLVPFDFSPRPELPPGEFFGSCFAQLNLGVVSDQGKVYGCYFSPLHNPDLDFGDLHQAGFTEIWAGEKRRGLIDAFPSQSCKVCPTSPWLHNNLIAAKSFSPNPQF